MERDYGEGGKCGPTTPKRFAELRISTTLATVFLPLDDDVNAFREFWNYRLRLLRDAGVEVLQRRSRFERAVKCKPYAFSYAGYGECCRLSFCPYCNAADAAIAYERMQRVQSRRKEIGFVANRITTCEDLSAIPRDLQAYFGDSRLWLSTPPPRPNEPFGTIIKYAIWPARQEDKAVLRSRYLHAVAADYARLVYESFLKRRKRSPKTWKDRPRSIRMRRTRRVGCP